MLFSIYIGILIIGGVIVVVLIVLETKKQQTKKLSNGIDKARLPNQNGIQQEPADEAGGESITQTKTLIQNELTDKTAKLEAVKNDLTIKNEKLEILLKEKNEELTKLNNNLSCELKNRQEFEKVKALLDEQIQVTKTKNTKLQTDLNAAVEENEPLKERIEQLEKAMDDANSNIKEKDVRINDLLKRLDTFINPQNSGEYTIETDIYPQEDSLPTNEKAEVQESTNQELQKSLPSITVGNERFTNVTPKQSTESDKEESPDQSSKEKRIDLNYPQSTELRKQEPVDLSKTKEEKKTTID